MRTRVEGNGKRHGSTHRRQLRGFVNCIQGETRRRSHLVSAISCRIITENERRLQRCSCPAKIPGSKLPGYLLFIIPAELFYVITHLIFLIASAQSYLNIASDLSLRMAQFHAWDQLYDGSSSPANLKWRLVLQRMKPTSKNIHPGRTAAKLHDPASLHESSWTELLSQI
jgi:hypothetical protein